MGVGPDGLGRSVAMCRVGGSDDADQIEFPFRCRGRVGARLDGLDEIGDQHALAAGQGGKVEFLRPRAVRAAAKQARALVPNRRIT